MRPGPLLFPRALLGALTLLAAAPHAAYADPAGAQPWAVVGRVVDELRRPVAGAEVALCVGTVEVLGRSGPNGDFRLARDAPPLDLPYAAIRAQSGDRVGTAAVWGDSFAFALEDVGPIVLHPATMLRVLVEGLVGPVRDAQVFVSVVPVEARDLFWAPPHLPWMGWAFRARTGADGTATFSAIRPGLARVLVLADGPRRGETTTRIPESGGEVRIGVERARDVAVTVLDRKTREPVRGAYVLVNRAAFRDETVSEGALDDPTGAPPTDVSGTTVLRSLPMNERLFLCALGKGWMEPGPHETGSPLERDARSVVIEAPPVVEKSWPTTWGDGVAVDDGTRATLVATRGGMTGWYGSLGIPAETATIASGQIVVSGRFAHYPGGAAVAHLPHGRKALLGFRGRAPVHFRASRRVEVVVHDERGVPLEGVGVKVGRIDWDYAKVTDAAGVAVFDEFAEEHVRVRLSPNAEFIEARRIGVFHAAAADLDLRAQDRRIELTIPGRREAVVRGVVEGRPGFPPHFSLRIKEAGEGLDGHEPTGAVLDPERAEIRFSAFLPDPSPYKDYANQLVAVLRAPDFTPSTAVFEEESPGGRLVARVKTEHAGAIEVVANLAHDGRWSPRLERKEGDEWEKWFLGPIPYEDIARGRVRYDNAWPGTYRVVDEMSGVRSDAVQVAAGRTAARMRLDLFETRDVEVSVRDDQDRPVEGGKLIVEGPDLERREYAIHRDGRYGDGTVVRVPGDRPVTIRAEHDTLEPDPQAPRIVVTGARMADLHLVHK